MKSLMKNPDFEVKYFIGSPAAHVAIFDAKDAYSTMLIPSVSLDASACLWSRNASFVELVQSYFEKKMEKFRKEPSTFGALLKCNNGKEKRKDCP